MKKLKNIRQIREGFVIFLALFMFVVFSMAISLDDALVQRHFRWLVLSFVSSTLIAVYTIYILRKNERIAKECQQILSQTKQKEMELEYLSSLQMMEQELQNLKSKKDDLQRKVLDECEKENYEEVNRYLSEWIEEDISPSFLLQTGNPVFDIILSQKILQAEKQDIHIALDIQNVELHSIETVDLNVILSNLLDNAIEAVMDLPKEQRVVEVHVKKTHAHFVLNILNSYDRNRMKSSGSPDGLPMTTKKDKSMHGYGLRSVKRIVDRYAGELILEEKELFRVGVVIADD